MGFATLDVDNRQPRWADELGADDLADEEEEGNLSEEKGLTPRGSRGDVGFDFCMEKGLTPRGSRGLVGFDDFNSSGEAAEDYQCRYLPRPDQDDDCELGDGQTLAQGEDAEDNPCRNLPRPDDDCELGDGQTLAQDRASTTMAAGDRFTFAVRAVILLIRCRGAMLASGTRPLFAWAASAALFRHRCPCDTAARFELLFSSFVGKTLAEVPPKGRGRGHGNLGGNILNGSVLSANASRQLEAAESAAVPSATSGAARRKDRRRRA
jgi:hypothetical protein